MKENIYNGFLSSFNIPSIKGIDAVLFEQLIASSEGSLSHYIFKNGKNIPALLHRNQDSYTIEKLGLVKKGAIDFIHSFLKNIQVQSIIILNLKVFLRKLKGFY